MNMSEAIAAFEARFTHVSEVEPEWTPPVGDPDTGRVITVSVERAPDALAPTATQEADLVAAWSRRACRLSEAHGGDVLLWKARPRLEVVPAVRDAPPLFALYARAVLTRSAG